MKHFVFWGGLAAVLLILPFLVVQTNEQEARRRQEVRLASMAHELESQFFLRRRPELEWLASQAPVRDFLAGVPGSPRPDTLLKETVGMLGIEVAYLISPSGTITAATDPSFLGVDASFRDYFRKGMAGLPSYSLAVGIVTGTHGIYASVPVYRDGVIVGVAAFRTSSQALDRWQNAMPGLLIVGPDGLVFSSQDPRLGEGQSWRWARESRAKLDGWFRVSRYPLDVVPGFTLVSLIPETWPWELMLVLDLLVLFAALTGLLVWRQRRLMAVREQERLLSHLLEGIAVFDSGARLLWANPAFERMIQNSGSPPLLNELWEKPGPWQEVLDGRRSAVVFESVLRGGPGGWIPVSAGFTAADGRYLLSVLDGTEHYRSDQMLRQSQKLTVLGQLSGGIAHDLNNMLGVLMGMADLLKISLPVQHPLQESVELILSTLGRAAALSEKMLAFARQTPMNRLPLDLTALLRELRFLARTALPATVVTEVTVPDEEVPIEGDENLLLSALLNLVLNAGEAMPDGGTVRVSGTRKGTRFLVVVEDEGLGMDKATLARIFEPFFTTKLEKGTGLGLSLVRRTILEHRGTIDVDSEPGTGTRVTLSLPLRG